MGAEGDGDGAGHFTSRTWATKARKEWLAWAQRCRLAPMRRVASVMRQHLFGVLNAVPSGVTDALAESIHAEIQWIERTACEFRDRGRSRDAIFCHWGGLDLHPASLQATTRLPEAPRTTASLLP